MSSAAGLLVGKLGSECWQEWRQCTLFVPVFADFGILAEWYLSFRQRFALPPPSSEGGKGRVCEAGRMPRFVDKNLLFAGAALRRPPLSMQRQIPAGGRPEAAPTEINPTRAVSLLPLAQSAR